VRRSAQLLLLRRRATAEVLLRRTPAAGVQRPTVRLLDNYESIAKMSAARSTRPRGLRAKELRAASDSSSLKSEEQGACACCQKTTGCPYSD